MKKHLEITDLGEVTSSDVYSIEFWENKKPGVYLFLEPSNIMYPRGLAIATGSPAVIPSIFMIGAQEQTLLKYLDVDELKAKADKEKEDLAQQYQNALEHEVARVHQQVSNNSKGISEDALLKALAIAQDPSLITKI